MIGSLMYLTASRPDIIYLKGTPVLGIWYAVNQTCKLVAFSDSDYAGCSLTRKSTSGGCQFFANCLVSWKSKKQTFVSYLIAEAEYIPAA
ncbi:hypothetical protein E3N88_25892 [Mikania micrantha]|uniref:Reverse transcriptase Ty1/copia-type domain-containing protein n=1 Tax=Mikania micrantha TaxID=192012 RepID=A0A5N6N7R1_9ASTR|nr:hypothetical protein E3N88_25892 [Mikania micrantha]